MALQMGTITQRSPNAEACSLRWARQRDNVQSALFSALAAVVLGLFLCNFVFIACLVRMA